MGREGEKVRRMKTTGGRDRTERQREGEKGGKEKGYGRR